MIMLRSALVCYNRIGKPWHSVPYSLCNVQKQKYVSLFKKFSTTPVRPLRNKLGQAKPKLESLEPQIDGLVVESENLDVSKLLKPFLFTIAFTTASYSAAAIWEFENVHKRRKQIREWYYERRKYVGKWRAEMNKWWNGLSEGEKLFVPLCFMNVLVFMAWKVPVFQPAMVKYFCSNPAAKAVCWPMVFSSFSHYSIWHIFANMYVLHSFSSGCVHVLGKEQFLGLYMAAGCLASFSSYVHKVLVNRPGLSLGASGAIMAVLGYSCTKFPDLTLNIIFLPFFTFKAGMAIKCIMALDTAGILLGWRFFDHAAHLGGALLGVFWASYGTMVWNKRGPLLQAWYSARKE